MLLFFTLVAAVLDPFTPGLQVLHTCLHCIFSLGPSCASSRFEPESLLLDDLFVIGVWRTVLLAFLF